MPTPLGVLDLCQDPQSSLVLAYFLGVSRLDPEPQSSLVSAYTHGGPSYVSGHTEVLAQA